LRLTSIGHQLSSTDPSHPTAPHKFLSRFSSYYSFAIGLDDTAGMRGGRKTIETMSGFGFYSFANYTKAENKAPTVYSLVS
jgi:hypothetical protein